MKRSRKKKVFKEWRKNWTVKEKEWIEEDSIYVWLW